jgi:hypothetical protein
MAVPARETMEALFTLTEKADRGWGSHGWFHPPVSWLGKNMVAARQYFLRATDLMLSLRDVMLTGSVSAFATKAVRRLRICDREPIVELYNIGHWGANGIFPPTKPVQDSTTTAITLVDWIGSSAKYCLELALRRHAVAAMSARQTPTRIQCGYRGSLSSRSSRRDCTAEKT